MIVLDEPTSRWTSPCRPASSRCCFAAGQLGLTYVFVSHDLALVRQLAHTVSVMQATAASSSPGPSPTVFAHPREPYTRTLLDAIPRPRAASGSASNDHELARSA